MTALGSRWRIAYMLDRLKRTCWCNLVDYVLSHRECMDASERQYLFKRTRDEDGDVTRYSLLRILVFGPRQAHCYADAQKKGSCYCAKFATKEAADRTTMDPKFIVMGTTPEARFEPPRTDGFLSA